jgi:kynurenine formamidase
MRTLVAGVLFAAVLVLPQPAFAQQPWLRPGRYVDLTHTFDERTIFWPTEPGFKLARGKAGVTEKGYYYAANRFATAEHGGTHLDAPIHFAEGRQTAEKVPLDRLMGEGAIVDVSEACAADPDYEIGVADLRAWEERHGRQLVDVVLLLRTGYAKHWPERKKYLGTDEQGPGAVAKLHFPGLSPLAARWLAEHRQVKSVGIDTASIDPGQSSKFEAHVALCERNIPIFENVDLAAELPSAGFTVIALPMKIGGGSGGPLRIVAIVPEKP